MEGEQTHIQEEIMTLDGRSASCDANFGGSRSGGESSFMEKPPPPFVLKTYHMVDDPTTNDIISWDSTGTSLIVWQPHLLATEIMGKYFRHNNFSSFVSQLCNYGFSKIDWDRWEFQNVHFQRGNKSSLRNVKRKTYNTRQQARSPAEPTAEISMGGNRHMDEENKKLIDEYTLLNEEMVMLKNQIEELQKELKMIKKEFGRAKRTQENLAMFVKQEVLKEGTGDMIKGKCSGFQNENAYMKLEKMLMMHDGVIDSSGSVGEEETCIHQPSNAINMEDLLAGPADWAQYAKELCGLARSINKPGTDEDASTRVIVSRAETDLQVIKELYLKRNSAKLEQAVSKVNFW